MSFDPTTPLTTAELTQNTHPKDSDVTALYAAIWSLPALTMRVA